MRQHATDKAGWTKRGGVCGRRYPQAPAQPQSFMHHDATGRLGDWATWDCERVVEKLLEELLRVSVFSPSFFPWGLSVVTGYPPRELVQ